MEEDAESIQQSEDEELVMDEEAEEGNGDENDGEEPNGGGMVGEQPLAEAAGAQDANASFYKVKFVMKSLYDIIVSPLHHH